MKIDITMGTKGRFQEFKRVMLSLNDQKNAQDLSLYIMDGNENDDDSVTKFLDNGKWRFEKINIYKEKKVLEEKDWGLWPKIYNYLIKMGTSPLVTYWSDDVYPSHTCFLQGARKFKDNKVGAVAFAWRDGNKPPTIYGTEMHKQVMVNFGLFRRKYLRRAKYINEGYHFYFADQDLSLKIWYLGHKVLRAMECVVTHSNGLKSKNKYRGGVHHDRDRKWFYSRWSYNRVSKRKVEI